MNQENKNTNIIGYDSQTGQPIYNQQNTPKEKLGTGFIISYIISFALFFISIFIFICIRRIDTGYITTNILSGLVYMVWAALFFVAALGSMVLSIILGVKNRNKITNENLKKKILRMIWVIAISHGVVVLYLLIDIYFPTSLFESKKIPEYDFNEVWSCSKSGSDDTRTYTFKKDGKVEAELDSNPDKYYLMGTYTIEEESIEDSIYTGERDGKIKKYTLEVEADIFVTNGYNNSQDPVNWYVSVYNGNYMKLTLPGGSYQCTMK